MLKNMYLLTTLTALSFISITASVDKINIIKSNLAHIAQAKKDIIADREMISSINKDIKTHIKHEFIGHLVEYYQYKRLSKTIKAIVNSITTLNEFTLMLDHVTDVQLTSIIDKQINYNNIAYTIEAYSTRPKPLKQLIDNALESEPLKSWEDFELLFNLYYLRTTQRLGYKLLLEKLDHKTQELYVELAALEANHHN